MLRQLTDEGIPAQLLSGFVRRPQTVVFGEDESDTPSFRLLNSLPLADTVAIELIGLVPMFDVDVTKRTLLRNISALHAEIDAIREQPPPRDDRRHALP